VEGEPVHRELMAMVPVVVVVPPVAADFAQEEHMQYVGLTRGRQETVCYAL